MGCPARQRCAGGVRMAGRLRGLYGIVRPSTTAPVTGDAIPGLCRCARSTKPGNWPARCRRGPASRTWSAAIKTDRRGSAMKRGSDVRHSAGEIREVAGHQGRLRCQLRGPAPLPGWSHGKEGARDSWTGRGRPGHRRGREGFAPSHRPDGSGGGRDGRRTSTPNPQLAFGPRKRGVPAFGVRSEAEEVADRWSPS